METALLNTVIGVSIVFFALIFISFCIYLLGFVPKIENLINKEKVDITKGEKTSSLKKTKKMEGIPAIKKDDNELIAVIVAAIATTMSETSGQVVPTDGLIIRSIKKRRA